MLVFVRASLLLIVIGVLCASGVQAEPMRAQAAAQAITAASQTTSSQALSGASAVLKVSATPPSSSDTLQGIPAAADHSTTSSVAQPLPANATPGLPEATTNPTSALPGTPSAGAVASATAGHLSGAAVQMQVRELEHLFSSPAVRRTYQRAATAFPGFCQTWERLLHEREVNNLGHLNWRTQGGIETANYTGYGKVESCECKASRDGLPIGKIRYEEIKYLLSGKTIEEAKHTAPKSTGTVNTLEIFSWDKNRWFY
jgi:hypothetical protein